MRDADDAARRTDGAALAAALRRDGFAVLRGAVDAATVASLRDAMAAMTTLPGDIVGTGPGRTLRTTVFNRDARFLRVLDPSPIIEAVEAVLGGDCHLVNQKAWINPPGCDEGAALHTDAQLVTMPEELCADPRYEPPVFIVSALLYLDDVDAELGPTVVVPGSHRSGRAPAPGERAWRGREPVALTARAGDAALFRCDLWHSGSPNRARDRSRRVVETAYGRREIAQKFHPYVNFRHDEAILAACSPRQRRLLGEHPVSAYG